MKKQLITVKGKSLNSLGNKVSKKVTEGYFAISVILKDNDGQYVVTMSL